MNPIKKNSFRRDHEWTKFHFSLSWLRENDETTE